MTEKTKWYEYSPNVTSALRIGFMLGICSGVLGLLFSMVFSLMIFFTKKWEAIPLAIAIATACGSIIAISDVAKTIQAHAEEKHKKEEKK